MQHFVDAALALLDDEVGAVDQPRLDALCLAHGLPPLASLTAADYYECLWRLSNDDDVTLEIYRDALCVWEEHRKVVAQVQLGDSVCHQYEHAQRALALQHLYRLLVAGERAQ